MDKIKTRIEILIKEKNDSKFNDFWSEIKKIIPEVEAHNKQIISQMTNYDLHDSYHSEKVIEIIEALLGERIEKLHLYELILIYDCLFARFSNGHATVGI